MPLIVCAGASIGLLIGILLGLSSSAVVATVVGTLTAGAAAYWTAGSAAADSRADVPNAMRAAAAVALSLGCLGGIGVGLWARTHDVLAAAPAEQVKQWRSAGYDERAALAIVAFRSTGLVLPGYTAQANAADRSQNTVLFAAHSTECQSLNPEDLRGPGSLRTAFVQAGGAWGKLAQNVAQLDDVHQHDALTSAWELVCR